MLAKLVMALVVKAPDCGILDGAVHALDLTIGPRVPRFGSLFNVELGAGELEGVTKERLVTRQHLSAVLRRPSIATRLGEVRAVIGEHGVDPVGNRRGESPEEVAGDAAHGLLVQLHKGALRGSVDGNERGGAALLCPDLGDVKATCEVSPRAKLSARFTTSLKCFNCTAASASEKAGIS